MALSVLPIAWIACKPRDPAAELLQYAREHREPATRSPEDSPERTKAWLRSSATELPPGLYRIEVAFSPLSHDSANRLVAYLEAHAPEMEAHIQVIPPTTLEEIRAARRQGAAMEVIPDSGWRVRLTSRALQLDSAAIEHWAQAIGTLALDSLPPLKGTSIVDAP
jgi:hypothetical protein